MSDIASIQDPESESVSSYDLLREDCGLLDLTDTGVLLLRGEDRKGWLQGQVTSDLRPLQIGGSIGFCFCMPTGQLLSAGDLFSLEEKLALLAPLATMPALLQRCDTAIIMEDVQYSDATEEFTRLSVQGPTATRRLGNLFELPKLDAGCVTLEGSELLVLRSNRTGFGGWDILVPADGSGASERLREEFQPVDTDSYEVARLEAGIPFFGKDMNERTLPPEMGQHFEARHISYKKGCYTGQEILMRIHSRGHTNKTWMGFFSDDLVSPGDPIVAGGKEVGTVTSAGDSPRFGPIGAAIVRNEVSFPGELVTIRNAAGETEAELQPMPLLKLG
jgi:folate-binding protein YgfZ